MSAQLKLAIKVIASEMDQRYESAMASGAFKGTATEFVNFDLTDGDMGEMIAEEFLNLARTTEEKVAVRVGQLIDNAEAAEASAQWWDEARGVATDNGDLIEIAALCIAQSKMERGD